MVPDCFYLTISTVYSPTIKPLRPAVTPLRGMSAVELVLEVAFGVARA